MIIDLQEVTIFMNLNYHTDSYHIYEFVVRNIGVAIPVRLLNEHVQPFLRYRVDDSRLVQLILQLTDQHALIPVLKRYE